MDLGAFIKGGACNGSENIHKRRESIRGLGTFVNDRENNGLGNIITTGYRMELGDIRERRRPIIEL